jgi:hypothetical protein
MTENWLCLFQSINQSMLFLQQWIHREFMPAIRQELLVWLILTFSTSSSNTTIQVAIDSNLDTRIYSSPGPRNSWAPTRLKVCFLEIGLFVLFLSTKVTHGSRLTCISFFVLLND